MYYVITQAVGMVEWNNGMSVKDHNPPTKKSHMPVFLMVM